jgi:hypothetical protein
MPASIFMNVKVVRQLLNRSREIVVSFAVTELKYVLQSKMEIPVVDVFD